jgi:hypothetical protein
VSLEVKHIFIKFIVNMVKHNIITASENVFKER